MAGAPPLLRCSGIRKPHAKALIGIYEYTGVVDGRPAYQQAGVSSGANLWFVEDSAEGPMWVVTAKHSDPKSCGVGDASQAIARSMDHGRWPWEAQDWEVCGGGKQHHKFVEVPDMCFTPLNPAAELRVELPLTPWMEKLGCRIPACKTSGASRAQRISAGGSSSSSTATFRLSGKVNDRPCFRQAGGGKLRMFFMHSKIEHPHKYVADYLHTTQSRHETWSSLKRGSLGATESFVDLPLAGDGDFDPVTTAGRWMIAVVKDPDADGEDDGEAAGVQTVVARSALDDGSTWASVWPWEVEAAGWEVASNRTAGLADGDALWGPADGRVIVHLDSPEVRIVSNGDDLVPDALLGTYDVKGMANGRVYYFQRLEDISLDRSTGPKSLWFAEDRGQWLITDPHLIGNSHAAVLARINSRTWWPWEAHLGATTSAASVSSAPFASLPPWFGGAAILAAGRLKWEVPDQETGVFASSDGMEVNMIYSSRCVVKANPMAQYGFLGEYEKAGLIASRPFFLQMGVDDVKKKPKKTKAEAEASDDLDGPLPLPVAARFALWFDEDRDSWVFTEDFRLLDSLQVHARVPDSAWTPWQIGLPNAGGAGCGWEVPTGDGGFFGDPMLRVEERPGEVSAPAEAEEKRSASKTAPGLPAIPPPVEGN